MQKVTDYYLFLHFKVSDAINDGWQPWGGPVTADDGSVLQACVRYASADPVAAIREFTGADGSRHFENPT